MLIKTSKVTAISVACAVWLTYSVPAYAASRANSGSNIPANVLQADDDDDGLSGGALAVLLLAIGGAVAGVLYAARGPDKIDCDRVSNEVTLRMQRTDANGKQRRSEWKAKLDEKSGKISLTRSGGSTHSQWQGKADGTYYPVNGDPAVDELSFTKVDASTMEFSARKAERITLTGRMTVSPNGRSLTIKTERLDRAGRRVSSQLVYSAR